MSTGTATATATNPNPTHNSNHAQPPPSPPSSPQWIPLAIASGTFAALNGLFAKLTTDEKTTALAKWLYSHIAFLLPGTGGGSSSSPSSGDVAFLEMIVRAVFLSLNFLCNFIMWTLFTRALTASSSTTKVSITNTAANFLLTAVLGMAAFQERVAGLWWLGAGMMGAGCILVGMREEGNKEEVAAS